MVEVLDAEQPDHCIRRDMLAPYLRRGFPWHTPEVGHPEFVHADTWWAQVEPVFIYGYEQVGVDAEQAHTLGRLVRRYYLEASRWHLYDDTIPVLSRLREHGWHHSILSNHVPELDQLVSLLGLGRLMEHIITSARVGYEKPHPAAFAIARRTVGNPAMLWMVGDSVPADIRGAEHAGLPAILVQRDGSREPGITWQASDLWDVQAILRSECYAD